MNDFVANSVTDSFVHLRVHTEYSVNEGATRIDAVVKRAVELNMPALGLADIGNMFGAVKFFNACRNNGIKPIIGCDIPINKQNSRMLLLCVNDEGYRTINKHLTKAYSENGGIVKQSWLQENNAGLIALSGGNNGALGQCITENDMAGAHHLAAMWKETFADRFYVEVWNTGRDNTASQNAMPHEIAAASSVAAQNQIPLVATHPVQCALESEINMLEVRRCIAHSWRLHDEGRPPPYSQHPYLLSAQQMHDNFATMREALLNSGEIAKRCNFAYQLGTNHLPKIQLSDKQHENETAKEAIVRLSQAGLAARGVVDKKEYQERLAAELKIINQTEYADYFLIVADFVGWAKQNDIPVGPGRGSGAASLVAYSLGITDIDPLVYGLLFERFLNPERVSLPDFDIDFCVDGRDRVIEYVVKKHGEERVAQIVTFGTIAARGAVRDAGRVLNFPYALCDRVARLIPGAPDMTIAKAKDSSPQLLEEMKNEEVSELIATSEQIEGLTRNIGTHAGGILIAPSPIVNFCPLYTAADTDSMVSQMDMNDVEKIGLVKFDFLGLKTLTILANATKLLKENHMVDADFSLDNIALDDKKVFDIYARGDTIGVFQCESSGMRRLMCELQPDRFEDIIALMALYRPGPLNAGMVKSFIARKKGEEAIDYPHDSLKEVLAETYGVYAYQEQVMEIARRLSGYSLGEADLLRRAMGKKNAEEMQKQRQRFVEGASDKLPAYRAEQLFDNIQHFAEYGFNKAHSAAYAVVSYRTAYLKAYYPEALYAAVMSADAGDTDRLKMLMHCAAQDKVTVLPPDINTSRRDFHLDADGNVVYGLQAIKGVGAAMIDDIIKVRGDEPFNNIFDFCRRVLSASNQKSVSAKLTRGALDNFVFAGAFDKLHDNRAAVCETLPLALEEGARQGAGLFGETAATALVDEKMWSMQTQLENEHKSLGFALSGSFYELYKDVLRDVQPQKLKEVENKTGHVLVAGVFQKTRTPKALRQRGLEVVVLDDDEMQGFEMEVDGKMFSEFRKKSGDELSEGRSLLLAEGSVATIRNEKRLRVERLYTINDYMQKRAKRLLVQCNDDMSFDKLQMILTTAQDERGQCEVLIDYCGKELTCQVTLGDKWHARMRVCGELRRDDSVSQVKVEYERSAI